MNYCTDKGYRKGSQLFYKHQYGIGGEDPRSTWLTGLLITPLLIYVVFLLGAGSPFPSTATSVEEVPFFSPVSFPPWPASGKHSPTLGGTTFVARFYLGFGIGPESATVPIFAAEATPPRIRGALIMQWQVWTAFGMMLGYASNLCLYKVRDQAGAVGLNWRLRMSLAMLPAMIVVVCIFMRPESPRWYMSKGRHFKAYQSMCKLRYNKIQAARDICYKHRLLETSSTAATDLSRQSLRHRSGAQWIASELLMFLQQVRQNSSTLNISVAVCAVGDLD